MAWVICVQDGRHTWTPTLLMMQVPPPLPTRLASPNDVRGTKLLRWKSTKERYVMIVILVGISAHAHHNGVLSSHRQHTLRGVHGSGTGT